MQTLIFWMPFVWLLAGCPAPPADLKPPGGGPGGPEGPAGAEGPGGGDQGGGPMGAIDLATHVVSMTQTEVLAGDHVTVTITFTGECDGTIHVEAIKEMERGVEVEGSPGDTPKGPITSSSLEGTGPMEIAIPEGASIRLGTFCDGNSDGTITPDEDGDAMGEQKILGLMEADIEVTVSLSGAVPSAPGEGEPPPEVPEDQAPEDGRPEGGPPPDGTPDGPENPDAEGPAPEGESTEGGPPEGEPPPEAPDAGEPPPPGEDGPPPPPE